MGSCAIDCEGLKMVCECVSHTPTLWGLWLIMCCESATFFSHNGDHSLKFYPSELVWLEEYPQEKLPGDFVPLEIGG